MIQISPDLAQFVEEEITSGRFPERDSVVAHALRLLQRDREEAIDGILSGLKDVADGKTQPLADAFDDLRHELHVPDDA